MIQDIVYTYDFKDLLYLVCLGFTLLYSMVVLYSWDRYKMIGLCKISDFIKQPCSSICLKKALAMHQSC